YGEVNVLSEKSNAHRLTRCSGLSVQRLRPSRATGAVWLFLGTILAHAALRSRGQVVRPVTAPDQKMTRALNRHSSVFVIGYIRLSFRGQEGRPSVEHEPHGDPLVHARDGLVRHVL